MESIRRSEERGQAEHGWLSSRHTFSFASYYDPKFIGFRDLVVINEDKVQPSKGFGTHGHRDMEILSYVLDGALEHQDSMGNGSVIRPGDVQRMSAGRGVQHSEYNPSSTEPVHFLQIWIRPDTKALEPSYEEKRFSADDKRDKLCLLASRDGRDGSVIIHQDIELYSSVLSPNQELEYLIPKDRYTWLQMTRGVLKANEHKLEAGDAIALYDVAALNLTGQEESEFLLFNLK